MQGPSAPVQTTPASTEIIHLPSLILGPSVTDIDIGRVELVCKFNTFGIAETNNTSFTADGSEAERLLRVSSMAIYELTSFFNHSCLPSAIRIEYGDAMVIRASRAIKAGEEVTLDYFGNEPDEMSQQAWGFTCKCAICVAKELDGPTTLAKRESPAQVFESSKSTGADAGANPFSAGEIVRETALGEHPLSSGIWLPHISRLRKRSVGLSGYQIPDQVLGGVRHFFVRFPDIQSLRKGKRARREVLNSIS